MIYLEKGEENTFVLTLTENVSISNPTFLFKFTWEMSEDLSPVYWIGADNLKSDNINMRYSKVQYLTHLMKRA
jgi:hypothetical protein